MLCAVLCCAAQCCSIHSRALQSILNYPLAKQPPVLMGLQAQQLLAGVRTSGTAFRRVRDMRGNTRPRHAFSASSWHRLPSDILSSIFAQLSRKDLLAVLLVCKSWRREFLREKQSICIKRPLSPGVIRFCHLHLPRLTDLSEITGTLPHTLSTLSRLTSVSLR